MSDRQCLTSLSSSGTSLSEYTTTTSDDGHDYGLNKRRQSEDHNWRDSFRQIFEKSISFIEKRRKRFEKDAMRDIEHEPHEHDTETFNDKLEPLTYREKETDEIEFSNRRGCKFDKQPSGNDTNYTRNCLLPDKPLVHQRCFSAHNEIHPTRKNGHNFERNVAYSCQKELGDGASSSKEEILNIKVNEDTTRSTGIEDKIDKEYGDERAGRIEQANNSKLKSYKERDEHSQSEQLLTMRDSRNDAFQQLRKNYNNLKKLFLALTIVNLILIVCVISVLPVILVTFKLSYGDQRRSDEDIKELVSEHLSSSEGRKVVSSTVLCVSCSSLDQRLVKYLTPTDDGRCCVEDISKIITVPQQQNIQEHEMYNARLRDVEKNQKSIQSNIFGLTLAQCNGSCFHLNETWPKHPEIQENNKLINQLLTRQRAAIHLKGDVNVRGIEWTSDMLQGKLSNDFDGIYVGNGGMYYVYSIIRFKKDACTTNREIGYDVKQKTGERPAVAIASVAVQCSGELTFDQNLALQRVFKVSVGQNTKLFIDVGDLGRNLVDESNVHSFGVFEL